jgi:hypothetical protein
MVVAQAQRVAYEPGRLSFVFSPAHRLLGEQVEQNRVWLEGVVEKIAGRRPKITVQIVGGNGGSLPADTPQPGGAGTEAMGGRTQEKSQAPAGGDPARRSGAGPDELRARAESHEGLKILREVFPIEIRDVEEL